MPHEYPDTQAAVLLEGPNALRLSTTKPVPAPGPRQILARTEAVGLCFSDLKLLHQFSEHARKGPILSGVDRDVLDGLPSYVPAEQPTVPGHEVALRIVAVGEGVKRYGVGDRFIVQADYRHLPTAGSNAAFGYNFEGALQEYVLMDERIVAAGEGRDGYLIPTPDDLGAAVVALVEPWACVECSYATPERRHIKSGGRVLVVAEAGARVAGLEESLSPDGPPASVTAAVSDAALSTLEALGAPIERVGSLHGLPDERFDDVVYFGAEAGTIEALNDTLAVGGILNVVLSGERIGRPVSVGVGRIHYGPTRWVGTTTDNAADGYAMIPSNGEIRPNDRVVVIGAGGPMGQMHVIRAAALGTAGASVTAADVDDVRLATLTRKAKPMYDDHGTPYRVLNTRYAPLDAGYTYYAIMAPVPAIVADAVAGCAPNAIINLFAGIPAPVRHLVDLDALIEKRVFVFGTSGSETWHMRLVLEKVREGSLDTGASVDAVSGMAGALDGLAAVESRAMAGKIIVYPALHDLPLTPLSALDEHYPTVAVRLKDGRWTREAEEELLRVAGREAEAP